MPKKKPPAPRSYVTPAVFALDVLQREGVALIGKLGDWNEKTNLREDVTATVSVEDVGTLRLPTGKLIVCDPLVGDDTKPLRAKTEPGRYPVRVSRLVVSGQKESTVLGASLVLAKGAVDVWTRAKTTDGRGRFPVDSATAAFFDASVLRPLFAMQDRENPRPPMRRSGPAATAA